MCTVWELHVLRLIIKTCTKISTVARVARNFIKLLNKKYRQPDCLPAWLHIYIVCIWKICYRFLIFGSPVLLFAWQWSISSLVCTIHWWASECFPTITHFSIGVSLSVCVDFCVWLTLYTCTKVYFQWSNKMRRAHTLTCRSKNYDEAKVDVQSLSSF